MADAREIGVEKGAPIQSRRERLLVRLGSPRVPWVVAMVAFVIGLPSVATGYFMDDRFHEYVLRGNPMPGGPRGPWDLYRFADGSPDFVRAVRSGWFPWWTNLDLRLAFFRPIPSLWRWADFRVFGGSAVIPHLETCLVYGALVFVAAKLYGRWVGGGAGGLGALAYAIDDGHAMPVMWIANRYALVAAIFGFGAVLAHVRARSSAAPTIGARLASPMLLALALASGETSLGVLGYLAGYALFVDSKGRRSGLVSLAPHAAVVVAWAIAYRAMGYGAWGSAFYVDPLASPAAFARKFVIRLPEILVSGVFGPPSEAWALVPPDRAPFAATGAALLALAIIGFVIRTAIRDDAPARRTVLSLATGSLVSLLPVCATIPDDRNFLIAGFGFFGVFGIAVSNLWRQRKSAPRTRRLLMGVLVGVHLVVAPLLLPLRGLNMALTFGKFIERGAATFPSGERVRDKVLVIVGVPDSLSVVYMMLERLLDGGPKARMNTILSVQSAGTFTMRCVDRGTVEIRNPVGELHSPFAALYSDRPYAPGQVFDRDLDRVEVLEVTPKGEPSAIRATIRVAEEERIWLVWQGQGLVEIPAPVPGETRTFDAVDLFTAMKR